MIMVKYNGFNIHTKTQGMGIINSTLEMEKEMATYSSVLAWRIPGTRDPGGVPSMGLHRVGHD